MTRKEFFKKCLDILLRQEFVHGMPLFECDEIVDSLTERKE